MCSPQSSPGPVAHRDRRKFRQKQERAWDLWLNCCSEREIAAETGIPPVTVHDWLSARISNELDFRAPPESRQHFDIWQFQSADGESSYFGRMPPQVIENLLSLFTEPGDIVADPFAGGLCGKIQ
jgi:hypothetical protein